MVATGDHCATLPTNSHCSRTLWHFVYSSISNWIVFPKHLTNWSSFKMFALIINKNNIIFLFLFGPSYDCLYLTSSQKVGRCFVRIFVYTWRTRRSNRGRSSPIALHQIVARLLIIHSLNWWRRSDWNSRWFTIDVLHRAFDRFKRRFGQIDVIHIEWWFCAVKRIGAHNEIDV